jgi:enterochelin esterase family protein
MGGLAAVYASLMRPDVFGRAAAQSGAFSIGEDALRAMVVKEQGALESGGIISRLPRMYIVIGAYETAVGGNEEHGNLLAANRRLIRLLQNNGYEISFEERPEGHSWGLWRGTLGQTLGFLFN